MATARQALDVARGEIGYSRWNDSQAGTKYGRWYAAQTNSPYYGTSGVPYCAMFVSWVLAQVGMTPPGGIYAYCPYGINGARNAGRLVSKTAAQPGDIVFFDWGGDGVSDHTGFVESYANGVYTCIEGNTSPGTSGSQSNGGGVYRRTRYASQICAVARPAYSAASPSSGSSEPAATTPTATAATDILEVIMAVKATHSVFTYKGSVYIANLLAGTYWMLKDPATMSDAITMLQRAGMKVVYHRELTVAKKSDAVSNPSAYGVYMGRVNMNDTKVS